MTAQEKALELYKKFYAIMPTADYYAIYESTADAVKILAKEIMSQYASKEDPGYIFWKDVLKSVEWITPTMK